MQTTTHDRSETKHSRLPRLPVWMEPVTPGEAIANALLEKEEARIAAMFRRRRIRFTVIKGLSWLKDLTADYLAVKRVRDIDFLIDARDLPRANAAVVSRGYGLYMEPFKPHQEYNYLNRTLHAAIETHDTVLNFDRSRYIDALFIRMSEFHMAGMTNRFLRERIGPRDPDRMIVLIVHYALHHCFCGRERLATIALHLAAYGPDDWDRLNTRVKYLGLSVYYAIILALIRRTFGQAVFPVPVPFRLSASARLYRWLFFVRFGDGIVDSHIDSPPLTSAPMHRRYSRTLQELKILCADLSVPVKALRMGILVVRYASAKLARAVATGTQIG